MMGIYRAGLRGFAVLAAVLTSGGTVGANTLKVLHSFCQEANCADGGTVLSLMRDAAGNLYGTTSFSSNDFGSIFEMSQADGKWTYRTLYHFSRDVGLMPNAPLIVDVAGNLYGSTLGTHATQGGTIFKLSHNADGSKWKYASLHDFARDRFQGEGGLTYAGAASGLPYDGVSTLYGPSGIGGRFGLGEVFTLTPPSSGRAWDYNVIYAFLRHIPTVGWGPFDTLTMDGAGNLYGGAVGGGANGDGTLFELSPSMKSNWKATILHTFCSQTDCSDGGRPFSNSVVLDAAGNIYGTTPQGGTCQTAKIACGVLYKVAPDGRESTLYTFCSEAGCIDGVSPLYGLTLGANGTLYGTTDYGGGHDQDPQHMGGGTLFSFDGEYRVLHRFCALSSCADGAYPEGSLIADGSGHLFGVAEAGGKTGHGTVFELTP